MTTVPGVAEAGQGGVFQTFSVRGLAGQRLLTLIDGMTIVTERRAGASGSFLDPSLMEEIEVLRGPAGTLYGSGALGGIVQVAPKRFEGWDLAAGYETDGDKNFTSAGWGGSGWSVGVAQRRARNGESASGRELNDRFRQVSAVFSKVWTFDDLDLEALVIPTLGRDIGKSNTDYPRRSTDYPKETHVLARIGLRSAHWNAFLWAHPSELHTRVRRDTGEGSDVENESLDFGGHVQLVRPLGHGLTGTGGIDVLSRRGVDAREKRFENFDPSPLTVLHALDGAASDDASAYGTLRFSPGSLTIESGLRVLYNSQSNEGYDTTADTGVVGFVGINISVGAGVEILANAGTGIRYPTLTERFFTGTTGRGGVLGNPGLDPEESRSLDLGLRWYGRRGWIELFTFANTIDDFIEQVDAGPDVSTFVNLTRGRIVGAELAALCQIDEHWSVRGAGGWLRGRNAGGGPLADVPPHRASLGGGLDAGAWTFRIDTEHRWPKNDLGPGEKPLPSATLLSARAGVRVGRGVTLSVYGTNLLDEMYFRAADEKAPEAYGRAAGITVTLHPR